MARVTTVKKAQKPQGRCEKCQKEIGVGDPYKWIKPRSHRGAVGHKRKRCLECPSWRPSETTSSPALSILYAAQEEAEDALGGWDASEGLEAAQEILNALAEGVREASQQYEESASNMEDGFGGETSISAEIREKGEALDYQADEVENSDLPEEWDEDSVRAEVVEEAGIEGLDPQAYDWDEDPEGLEDAYETRLEEWGDEVRSAVEEAFQSVEGV